jgi:hypothetical protein
MRAEAALSPLLSELAAATRHGNPDRIATAAEAAMAKGDLLVDALSRAFASASDASAAAFDTLHANEGAGNSLAQAYGTGGPR